MSSAPTFDSKWRFIVLPLLLASATVYMLGFYTAGWIPHDEGLLAQSAERVLDGQMPHRDFDEMYTGGMTFFHALVFKVLGMKMASLRWCVFGLALISITSWYMIARFRFTPIPAALITAVGFTWSFPNYFAALPTWYHLTFTSLAILALLTWMHSGRRTGLAAAGLSCGLAMLIKITGLYSLAAALITIACFHSEANDGDGPDTNRKKPSRPLVVVAGLMLVGFVLLLVRQHLSSPSITVFFVVPSIAAAVAAIRSSHEIGSVPQLVKDGVLFSISTAIPLAIFVLPYLISGATDALLEGVFIAPQLRLKYAVALPLSLDYVIPSLLVAGVLYGIPKLTEKFHDNEIAVITGVFAAGAWLTVGNLEVIGNTVYRFVFLGAYYWLPILSVLILAKGKVDRFSKTLIFFTATTALVQYPYSTGIYFCYVAPLILLVSTAVLDEQFSRCRRTAAVLLMFLLFFAVAWLNTGDPRRLGTRFLVQPRGQLLTLPRSQLRIPQEDWDIYRRLVARLNGSGIPDGSFVALPDCPEVYFLAEQKNSSRSIYDFFDHGGKDAGTSYTERIFNDQTRVVVINRRPEFSEPVSRMLIERLSREFADVTDIGHFTIYRKRRLPNTLR